MRFIIVLLVGFSLISQGSMAQVLKGTVVTLDDEGDRQTIPGATLVWEGTTKGGTSDAYGNFEIDRVETTNNLIVSAVQYVTDTFAITKAGQVVITLSQTVELHEVEVRGNQQTTKIDYLNPIKVETMGEDELMKAACCNLSESFETNPSVDVSFSDAVTGTRQIEMLGLAGPNTQIMRENMPDVRGLSALYGLTFTPGTWVESIQLNKGTGSVVNGYESVAGQINVELRKPETAEKLYFNLYANEGSRIEVNAHSGIKINEKLSTAILVHGKNNSMRMDRNGDDFMDMPTGSVATVMNRWKYKPKENLMMQAGIKGTFKEHTAGHMDFESEDVPEQWGMNLNIRRVDGWYKMGYINPNRKQQSFALQMSGSYHEHRSQFGNRIYDADQRSGYANFIYQDFLGNTNHQIRAGASLQYDYYDEIIHEQSFQREEIIPGVYSEYTYKRGDNFSLVTGLRADHHNQFGWFATPRVHTRWAVAKRSILRASFGRGQRHPAIIAENNGLLASNRTIVIEGNGTDNTLYGLQPEVAWNYGLNFTQNFTLDYRDGYFSFDFYRTDFQNQIVIDWDRSPQEVAFYNLSGESFSNSFQGLVAYEAIRRLDVKLAYRFFDVQTTYDNTLREKPLVARHRAFVNLAYETPSLWKFDATVNWIGAKRLPQTNSNPVEYQLADYSRDYWTVNAQVSKSWSESFDVYLGVENLFNFKQSAPILASDEAFGNYFDASMIWGPIFGRVTYVGLRYKIK